MSRSGISVYLALVRPALSLRARSAYRVVAALARTDPLAAVAFAATGAVCLWYLATTGRARASAGELAAAGLGVVVSIQLSRRDARWLALAGLPPRGVFAAEYFLLLLPLAAGLALVGDPWLGAAIPFAGSIVALLPTGVLPGLLARGADRRPIPIPVPARSFEWIAGLRRSLVAIGVVYLLAVPASAIPAGPIVLILLGTWTSCGFYTDFEGRPMLRAYEARPGAFLRTKIMRALGAWAILIAPIAAAFLIRHPMLWPYLGVAVAGCGVVLAGCVLLKYAAYREGLRMGAMGALAPLILAVALVVPPIAFFLLVRLWRLAEDNLRAHLDAFD